MAAIITWRRWLRRPLRQKWWAVENWLHGYKFGPVRRHRCCDHTTPSHYRWCAKNGRSES